MTTREKYQAYLDKAYPSAPFRVVIVHDLDHVDPTFWPKFCEVCGNRRLRYLCACTDKDGKVWLIGRDCHTKLEERYEADEELKDLRHNASDDTIG